MFFSAPGLRSHAGGMLVSKRLTRLRLTVPPNSGQEWASSLPASALAAATSAAGFCQARTTKTTPNTAATQAASTQRRRAGNEVMLLFLGGEQFQASGACERPGG